jgi:hypothetical protein
VSQVGAITSSSYTFKLTVNKGEGAMFRFFIRAAAPSGSHPERPVAGFRRSTSIQSKASGCSKVSVRSVSRPLPETPNLHHNRPLHVLITEDNKINQVW